MRGRPAALGPVAGRLDGVPLAGAVVLLLNLRTPITEMASAAAPGPRAGVWKGRAIANCSFREAPISRNQTAVGPKLSAKHVVPPCQGSPERIDRQAYDNRTIRHPKPRSAQVSLITSGVTSLSLFVVSAIVTARRAARRHLSSTDAPTP